MQVAQLETYSLEPEVALEKWKEYVKVEKQTSEQHITDLKKAYRALSQGKKVIDVFETVKRIGLNTEQEPALAIAPMTEKRCLFTKASPGGGSYGVPAKTWRQKKRYELTVPNDTFPAWPDKDLSWQGRRDIVSTVPIVPPEHMPASVHHRYILYEVEHWRPVAPKDPILLYRLTKNLFAIEAKWNLSKLERAIIRGRI